MVDLLKILWRLLPWIAKTFLTEFSGPAWMTDARWSLTSAVTAAVDAACRFRTVLTGPSLCIHSIINHLLAIIWWINQSSGFLSVILKFLINWSQWIAFFTIFFYNTSETQINIWWIETFISNHQLFIRFIWRSLMNQIWERRKKNKKEKSEMSWTWTQTHLCSSMLKVPWPEQSGRHCMASLSTWKTNSIQLKSIPT